VTHDQSKTVSVIDTITNTVTATVPVGSEPSGVAVTPDGAKIYVASYDSGTLSIIDTTTNTVKATVNIEWARWGCSYSIWNKGICDG
jgi:YVTN family beta-propeller protein